MSEGDYTFIIFLNNSLTSLTCFYSDLSSNLEGVTFIKNAISEIQTFKTNNYQNLTTENNYLVNAFFKKNN